MRYCANNGCMNGLQPNFGVSAGMNRVRRIIDNEYDILLLLINESPIAMAYVPWQRWGETYDAENALANGTLFPELNLPFTGRNCERGGNRG